MLLSDTAHIDLIRDTLFVVLKIVLPILAAGMVVGLVISVFQSVTSIQDQTLTFVPKIVSMVIVAALLLPWIGLRLAEFATEMFRLF